MSQHDDEVQITVTYRLDEQRGEVRCDFPSDDERPEGSDAPTPERDDRAEALFEAVLHAVTDELEDEGVRPIGGGEVRDAENAVSHHLGTDEDVFSL